MVACLSEDNPSRFTGESESTSLERDIGMDVETDMWLVMSLDGSLYKGERVASESGGTGEFNTGKDTQIEGTLLASEVETKH